MYSNAQSFLRGTRRDDRYSDVRAEQSSLFNWKRGSSASASWTHKFVCLSSTNADRVPTSKLGKLALEEAGIGEKTVTVPNIKCNPEDFRLLVLATYPKLQSGGGFELLRCKPQSRDLLLIGHRISSSPKMLKRQVGNGKVYIRPIQRDLTLEVVASEDVEGVGTSFVSITYCLFVITVPLCRWRRDAWIVGKGSRWQSYGRICESVVVALQEIKVGIGAL